MNGKKWSKDEESQIKIMFDKGYSDEQMANILDRPITALASKRAKLGLKRDLGIEWTDEKDNFIKKLHKEGFNSKEIAEKFSKIFDKISRYSVIGRLNRMGISGKDNNIIKINRKQKPLKLKTQEGGIYLLDATYSQCRYPFSTGANMRVCGKDRCNGAYCEEHAALCFQKRTIKDEFDGI